MARPELEVPRDHLVVQGDRGIAVGDRFVPTDANGRQLINHYGPAGTFPTFSMQDLVRGAIEPAALAGRVVLVGVSAAGAGDLFATPYMSRLPGSEFLATTIDHILAGRSLVRSAVPEPAATAAADASRAAFALLAELDHLDAEWRHLTVSIGIHRGPVLMGGLGGATQCQFTVAGDTVNVARRLETLTRQHGTDRVGGGDRGRPRPARPGTVEAIRAYAGTHAARL